MPKRLWWDTRPGRDGIKAGWAHCSFGCRMGLISPLAQASAIMSARIRPALGSPSHSATRNYLRGAFRDFRAGLACGRKSEHKAAEGAERRKDKKLILNRRALRQQRWRQIGKFEG